MLRKFPLKANRPTSRQTPKVRLLLYLLYYKKAPPTLKERVTDGAENQQGRDYAGPEELSEGCIPPATADPYSFLMIQYTNESILCQLINATITHKLHDSP